MKTLESARVAIVHEWLVTYAGSERALDHDERVPRRGSFFSVVDFLEEGG